MTLLSALLKRALFKIPIKLAVPFYAIKGNYPWWMVTPDDPVSPFGSGTTPTASREPSQMTIYRRFGRYVGDVVWLGWRNSGYGYAYSLKPDWLKNPDLKYEDLVYFREERGNKTVYYVSDGENSLTETQYHFGPITLIVGWRVQPIYDGAIENEARLAQGLERAPRPAFHPNMDGRPLISLRTKRTM